MRLWIIPVSFGAEMVWRVIRSCTKLLKFQICPLESPKSLITFLRSFPLNCCAKRIFPRGKFFFLLVRIENPRASRNGIILLFKKKDKIQSYVNIYIWLLKRFCSFTKLRKKTSFCASCIFWHVVHTWKWSNFSIENSFSQLKIDELHGHVFNF